VVPELVGHGRLYAMSTDDYWLDTGRPEEYLRANLDLLRGLTITAGGGVHPGAAVDRDAIVVESVIGPGAEVAAGVTITDSLLLPNAEIGSGSVIERSIVAGSVGDRCVVTDAVIGANYELPAGTSVASKRLPDPG
jgi:mannose-1-phosphate guanylyltransferase